MHITPMESIKRYGNVIIFICVIIEMLIWPSINNLFGCLMTIISWFIFSRIGLNKQVAKEHIFAWLVFVSMSLYRILPLIATYKHNNTAGKFNKDSKNIGNGTDCWDNSLYRFESNKYI